MPTARSSGAVFRRAYTSARASFPCEASIVEDRFPQAARERPSETFDRAWRWARERRFEGVDPYDALASPLLSAIHRFAGRAFGIAVTQAVRRSPWNPRPLLGIRPAVNPKAIALFASAAARTGRVDEARTLGTRLLRLASPDRKHACWGYPFPWQGRSFFLPAGMPTVVVTSFAGEALLDCHGATGEGEFLDGAQSACEFVRSDLHRTEDSSGACVSYSPIDTTTVLNASLLGARLLVKTGVAAGSRELFAEAEPLVRYALARQRADGSWPYGGARTQAWSDSFHTGFVLGALETYRGATGDETVAEAVSRGSRHYRTEFFGPRGEPYYFPGRRMPLDIHSAAQGVLALTELSSHDPSLCGLAASVGDWMVENLLDPEGFFRYQKRRSHVVSIPYMRWSQAWGVRALAERALAEGKA